MMKKHPSCVLLLLANTFIGVCGNTNHFSLICKTGSSIEFSYGRDGNLALGRSNFGGDDFIWMNDDRIFPSNFSGGTRGRFLTLLENAPTSEALPFGAQGKVPRDLQIGNQATFYTGRPCLCHPASVDREYFGPNDTIPDFYLCPDEAEYCGLPYPGEGTVACFDITIQEVVARNAWPLILLWYFGMVIICCCTMHGKTGMAYIRTFWNPDQNQQHVEELRSHTPTPPRRSWDYWGWQRYRFESALLAQAAWLHRHEEYTAMQQRRDEDGGSPLRYEMRTRRYSREEHAIQSEHEAGYDDHDSLHEPSCTICFVPLEDGDTIGDLQCQHTFHKSCLKSWATRKNACPLCNVQIATRRADGRPASRSQGIAEDQA